MNFFSAARQFSFVSLHLCNECLDPKSLSTHIPRSRSHPTQFQPFQTIPSAAVTVHELGVLVLKVGVPRLVSVVPAELLSGLDKPGREKAHLVKPRVVRVDEDGLADKVRLTGVLEKQRVKEKGVTYSLHNSPCFY